MIDKPTNYFEHHREELLNFIPEGSASILDIGCGSGGFLSNFDNKIYRVGIEPDIAAAEIARQRADLIITGEFNEKSIVELLEFSEVRKFDCIFFNDVLEHLYDPWSAIQLCKKILRPEGVIIASIPNILFYSNIWNILKKQDFVYENAGLMDITHVRFFTKKSMIRMFEKVGFDIKLVKGINSITSLKYHFFNFLLLNKIRDLKYLQFVIVAKTK